MADDFMLEEEEQSNGSPNRRNFLIIVGVLGLILIAALICNFTLLNRGNTSNFAAESTAIAQQNVEIATQNAVAAATWTAEAEIQNSIIATNEAQPEPTDIPEIEPTNTEEPEEEPTPTNTAVVKEEATATPNLSGTSEFDDSNADDDDNEDVDESETPNADDESETPDAVVGGNTTASTATPITSSNNNQDALPDTGINTWGTIVIGLILAGILIGVRRMRQA